MISSTVKAAQRRKRSTPSTTSPPLPQTPRQLHLHPLLPHQRLSQPPIATTTTRMSILSDEDKETTEGVVAIEASAAAAVRPSTELQMLRQPEPHPTTTLPTLPPPPSLQGLVVGIVSLVTKA